MANPTLINQNPAPGAVGVSRNSTVYFIVAGPDGVDGRSASIEIDYGFGFDPASGGGYFVEWYNGPASLWVAYDDGMGITGYEITVDPTFEFPVGVELEIRVHADPADFEPGFIPMLFDTTDQVVEDFEEEW